MNKKGFTIVETIVSFSLVSVIFIFLLQIIFSLKTIYDNSGIKTEVLNRTSLISNTINSHFENKIYTLNDCGNNCIEFVYQDGTKESLKITNNILEFGNFKTDLPEDTFFKDVNVDITYSPTFNTSRNNAILNIKIPIVNNDNEYLVNIAYQFNTDSAYINYVSFKDTSSSYITLNGSSSQTFDSKTAYVEEGYKVYDRNGNEIEGNVVIDNPLTTVPYKTGRYNIKYSLMDNGRVINEVTRGVTITPSSYTITNLVTNGSFENELIGWTANTDSYRTNDNNYYSGNASLLNYNSPQWTGVTQYVTNIENHKYYFANYSYTNNKGNGACYSELYYPLNGSSYYVSSGEQSNLYKWDKMSIIHTIPQNINQVGVVVAIYSNADNSIECYIDDIILIDLTEAFGDGNEPDQEWCDENINWFEGIRTISY